MEIAVEEAIRRRRVAMALVFVAEISRIREQEQSSPRLWSRPWLQRREAGQGVLSMLYNELRSEDPLSFENFIRMNEGDFKDLICQVTPLILRKNTVMRQAISPRDRLAVTLRYLATGNSLMDLSYSTRIAPNTLSQIIPSTCEAIKRVLTNTIKFPSTSEEWEQIACKFQALWQFPHCLGALDGKHVSFRPPRSDGSHFRNYKGTDSIILLALVDAEYKFIFVDIGKNGRVHDARVFRESPLGTRLESQTLGLPVPSRLPGFAHKLPFVFVGDDAFPLKENLMKPYPERGMTREKRIHNYRLSRARRTVENAFGILTNRFRVLLNAIPLAVEKVELITFTCVLLHNYLLDRRSQWQAPSDNNDNVGNDPFRTNTLTGISSQCGNRSSVRANQTRDAFCEYFNSVGSVPWQNECVNY